MSVFNKLPKEHVFQESDSNTCGPCCMAMVYGIKGKKISMKDILKDFHHGEKGDPTYPPQLARHFLKNGFKTRLTISNSRVISPAWKNIPKQELIENLKLWLTLHQKNDWRGYGLELLFYLQEGGEIALQSYTSKILKDMLDKSSLLILGVDEDWVWEHRFRAEGSKRIIDEIRGGVEGHFVLVTGHKDDKFHVLDPFPTHIEGRHGAYDIDVDQLTNASLIWASTVVEVLQ